MKTNKAITGAVFTVVAAGIALAVGVWAVMLTYNAINLPTIPYQVVNESISIVNKTNVAFTSVTNSACRAVSPIPSVCGVQQGGVIQLLNATHVFGPGNYTYTQTQINGTITCASLCPNLPNLISYTYYDFQNAQLANTFTTSQTNVFNSLLLLSVGLIILGAAVIISYFYSGGGVGAMGGP